MKPFRQTIQKFWVLLLVEARRDTQSLIGFCAQYLWIFLLCFIYGFFFRSALWQKNIQVDNDPMGFPLFLVSGLMVVRIIPLSIRVVETTLSNLKNSGLAEWTLTTPTPFWELFAAKAFWNGARAATELVAFIGFARLLIGTPLWPFIQGQVIGPIFFAFMAYAGIGMIISSATLFLRKGSILFSFFFQISVAFGGVFFPTRLFDEQFKFLSILSDSLPITHALHAVRFALIHENTPGFMAHRQYLATITLVFITTGFILLQKSLIWARKNGEFSKELHL